eukprot:gene2357-biopygen2005
MAEVAAAALQQRAAFEKQPFPDLSVRKDRLKRLLDLTERHEADICAAISSDFGGRSTHETRLAELFVVRAGIRREDTSSDSLEFDPRTPAELARAGFAETAGRATTIDGLKYQFFSKPN